jgi:hypothetical protein
VRDWGWELRENGPNAYLRIDFQVLDDSDVRKKVGAIGLPSFTFGDAQKLLGNEAEGKQVYVDAENYESLPCFTGRSHDGAFYMAIVERTGLQLERFGFDGDSAPAQAVTAMLRHLLSDPRLRVKRWQIRCGEDAAATEIAQGGDDLGLYLALSEDAG